MQPLLFECIISEVEWALDIIYSLSVPKVPFNIFPPRTKKKKNITARLPKNNQMKNSYIIFANIHKFVLSISRNHENLSRCYLLSVQEPWELGFRYNLKPLLLSFSKVFSWFPFISFKMNFTSILSSCNLHNADFKFPNFPNF